MGAEVKAPVIAARGRGSIVAAGLDTREAVISSVKLTVEMAGFREEVVEAGLKESPIGCDPEGTMIVVFDLGEVVVVEALRGGEASIGAVF